MRPSLEHYVLQIPDDDPRWRGNRTCFNMPRYKISKMHLYRIFSFLLRSAPALHIPDCTAGLLDQMNALTAWLDNSNVYGSNEKDLNDIRLEE